MTRASSRLVLFVLSAAAAWSQTPTFEVASIKPAALMERGKMMIGFGGDAGRINYTNVSLKDVVARAYEMKPYQVSGPAWMDSERYDITAKIPDGVSRDKVPEMLRNLLPRFVATQLYRGMLESVASEHAARMTAMDSASNNASEMIDSLTLTMNRVRQAAITKEIIEIVSGAAAL